MTLSVHSAILITTIFLFANGYDVFPTHFKDLPIDLDHVPYKSRSLAWLFKDNFPNGTRRLLRDPAHRFWIRKIESYSFSVHIIYQAKHGNIFTKKNLQMIKLMEEDLVSSANHTKFCATVDKTLKCKHLQSVIQFFDGTFSHVNEMFNNTFENISSVLFEANQNNRTKDTLKYFLSDDYKITSTFVHASMTRTKIPVGYPSPVGGNKNGDIEKETKNYMNNEIKPKLIKWKQVVKDFDIYYISWFYFHEALYEQTFFDLYFTIGSMCFIFCFMVFYTRSLWITVWAVFSIFTSYLGTNLLYRYIIGYKYFGYFHIIVIFIILGIGADDLFVFYDTWRLTSSSTNLARHLSEAYSKSMFSMFVTSLTTSLAFFVSALSPFLCTKSFGIFSGILVIINYISVITFFPAVLILFRIKFETICRGSSQNDRISNSQNINLSNSRESSSSSPVSTSIYEPCSPSNDIPDINGMHKNCSLNYYNLNQETIEVNTKTNVVKEQNKMNRIESALSKKKKPIDNGDLNQTIGKKNCKLGCLNVMSLCCCSPNHMIVSILRDHYSRFITKKYSRIVILIMFLIILVFFLYHATHLEPDEQQPNNYQKCSSNIRTSIKFFKNGHNLAEARYYNVHGFQKYDEDRFVKVYILWGIKERDKSICNFTSVSCIGKQVYDEEFDPNPTKNQLALKFSYQDFRLVNKLHPNDNFTLPGYRPTLPWNYSKTMEFMNTQPEYYWGSFNESFTDYFDIPLQFWLLNANTLTYSADYTMFNGLIGEQRTPFSQKPVFGFPTYYGNKIKYLAIQINTTIDKYRINYKNGIPIVERWEAFVNKMMKELPRGLQNGYQLTPFQWDWLYVQQTMSNSAILGLVLGLSLFFPIITISTMNIIIGLVSTLTICCTTVCVVGVIPLVGWKLGLLESINLCLVVGLSVDYVVHLAEGYHLSKKKTRLERTRDMLESMGSPILSGAISTLGAAFFLFFCQIQFALQFGVFLFCTIGFSLLFSLGLFSTLMGFIGPENSSGSLKGLCSWFKNSKKYTVASKGPLFETSVARL
ncbi:hypothetical protein KUTeg_013684 [Tegillarca granosa]|uniref:SSD domain-containing protein n=1 Tax=Tegillarca granosa TaxID=220873 RepID=A0ABQ9EUG0_TEGGR|nr:hypothetical protein KUTeg_013684 [Tegillarca granosa]